MRYKYLMTGGQYAQPELFVPMRFEALRRDAEDVDLRGIVVPVEEALQRIDLRSRDIRTSRQGGLTILRGETGAGKSTFLETVRLFREGVESIRIAPTSDIGAALEALPIESAALRIVIIEGREALKDVTTKDLESWMHGINSFVRSDNGSKSLVVWPTNKDDLTEQLVEAANALGGEALTGPRGSVEKFAGPARSEFPRIAGHTVAIMNEGASLATLGISDSRAVELAAEAKTIGHYLTMIRDELAANSDTILKLMPNERYRMWVVVVAESDTEGEVAALTRGGFATTDLDRLLTSTGANVVEDLKREPEKIGILGTVLDSKLFHMDPLTALAVARLYGESDLHAEMRSKNMSIKPDPADKSRLAGSELGTILSGASLATRKRGPKPGDNTMAAFANLMTVAEKRDTLLNRAIGKGLKEVGLIDEFESEKRLNTGYNVRSDLYCLKDGQPLRLEIMWRSKGGRATIANYALGKLARYGRAIGLIS